MTSLGIHRKEISSPIGKINNTIHDRRSGRNVATGGERPLLLEPANIMG
jgi:hypothetical protein